MFVRVQHHKHRPFARPENLVVDRHTTPYCCKSQISIFSCENDTQINSSVTCYTYQTEIKNQHRNHNINHHTKNHIYYLQKHGGTSPQATNTPPQYSSLIYSLILDGHRAALFNRLFLKTRTISHIPCSCYIHEVQWDPDALASTMHFV